MGCCLSHLQIWQNLIKETDNDTTYLILEDDAVLLDNWYQCLMDAFYDNKIPIDWDIVYLGGTGSNGEDPLWHTIVPPLLDHLQGGIHQMKPNSFYGQNPPNRFLHFTTIAYLINKKGAIRTLDLINRGNGFWTAVDHVLAHRMQETDEFDRKIYFFYPHIASYYQVETPGFAKIYSEENTHGILDSDIWKNNDSFEESHVKDMIEQSKSLNLRLLLSDHKNHIPEYVGLNKQRYVNLIFQTDTS